jgi:hypothetical protein
MNTDKDMSRIGITLAKQDELLPDIVDIGDDLNRPMAVADDHETVMVKLDDIDGDLDQAATEIESRDRAGRVRNAGFVQVSKVYIDEMNQLAMYAPTAHRALWTLVKLMNKQNAVAISQESLAIVMKVSTPTVKRAVSLLRKQQWLDVFKMGTANVYRVNSRVVWQDRPDGKWAAFNARVILNFGEQDATTKSLPPVRTRHMPFVVADDEVPPPRDDGGRE